MLKSDRACVSVDSEESNFCMFVIMKCDTVTWETLLKMLNVGLF